MLKVVYERVQADIKDLRYFKNAEEFNEWFARQNEVEPVIIITIEEEP